jgi:hypothetical protein
VLKDQRLLTQLKAPLILTFGELAHTPSTSLVELLPSEF